MSFIESKTKLLKNKLASLVFIKSCKKVVIHKKYGSDYPVYGHLSRFIYILPWQINNILIIQIFLPAMPQNALLYAYLRHFQNHQNLSQFVHIRQLNANKRIV